RPHLLIAGLLARAPIAGIGQIHRDLGVLNTTGGASVLALHADGVAAFFTSPISSTTEHLA
ncbi:MAG: hypothetical protein ACRDTH_13415, partial [Pseudonocardiaceae bacterium]